MYQVDDLVEVKEIENVAQSCVGAPLPAVVATDYTLDLIYLVEDPDPSWDGTYVNVIGPDTEQKRVACVRFDRPYAHFFGPPNDEAFEGHPLASKGVRPYSAWTVHPSPWVRSLERMNAVHPYHDPKSFEELRHFIFAFHDSTFECVAKHYSCRLTIGSIAAVASSLAASWT